MNTLTKHDLAKLFEEERGMSSFNAKQLVEDLISLLKTNIFERKAVYFPRMGHIITTVKAPRPGRNPQTKVETVIGQRHSVRFARGASHNPTKYTKLDLHIDLMGLGYSRREATSIMNMWFGFVEKVLTNDYRIEFRGLGVIYPRVWDCPVTRNPKTGETVTSRGARIRLAFKCSTSLRKAMDKAYL